MNVMNNLLDTARTRSIMVSMCKLDELGCNNTGKDGLECEVSMLLSSELVLFLFQKYNLWSTRLYWICFMLPKKAVMQRLGTIAVILLLAHMQKPREKFKKLIWIRHKAYLWGRKLIVYRLILAFSMSSSSNTLSGTSKILARAPYSTGLNLVSSGMTNY